MAKFAGQKAPGKGGSKKLVNPKRGGLKKGISKVALAEKRASATQADRRTIAECVKLDAVGKANYTKLVKQYREKILQPKPRTYGGMGFAKPSIWIDCLDNGFMTYFQEVYEEHIVGFASGAASFKNKQKDENMLWRQRLKARQQGDTRDANDIESVIEGHSLTVDLEARMEAFKQKKSDHKRQQDSQDMFRTDIAKDNQSKSAKRIGTTKAEQSAAARNVSVASGNPFNKRQVQNVTKGNLDVDAQRKAIEQYRLLKQRQRQQKR